MRNILYSLFALFFLTSISGMAGVSILTTWYAGVELQPAWVKVTNVLVILGVLWGCIKSITSDSKKNFDYDNWLYAIFGLILIPVVVGMSGEGSVLDYVLNEPNPYDGIVQQFGKYLALPFNCIYIFKVIIHPLSNKYCTKKSNKKA